MEKVIYALWRDPRVDREKFNARLLGEGAERLEPYAHALRINLKDKESQEAVPFEFTATRPPIDAVIQIWVDCALDYRREAIDAIVAKLTDHYAAWLVTESTPLPLEISGWRRGQRSRFYTHIAFISVPPRLTWAAWRDLWQTHHTQVAIETQSTVEYVQNLIVRPLTYNAPGFSAIIEESFPLGAATDDALFHNAVGDPEKHAKNKQRLSDSTFSFTDLSTIDLLAVGQYDFKMLRSIGSE